jgi:hypothetical protein
VKTQTRPREIGACFFRAPSRKSFQADPAFVFDPESRIKAVIVRIPSLRPMACGRFWLEYASDNRCQSEPTEEEPGEFRAPSITGEEERLVTAGDFVRIPAGVLEKMLEANA